MHGGGTRGAGPGQARGALHDCGDPARDQQVQVLLFENQGRKWREKAVAAPAGSPPAGRGWSSGLGQLLPRPPSCPVRTREGSRRAAGQDGGAPAGVMASGSRELGEGEGARERLQNGGSERFESIVPSLRGCVWRRPNAASRPPAPQRGCRTRTSPNKTNQTKQTYLEPGPGLGADVAGGQSRGGPEPEAGGGGRRRHYWASSSGHECQVSRSS